MLPLLVLGSLSLSAQLHKSLKFTGAGSYAETDPTTPQLISNGGGYDATIEFWVYVPVSEAGIHHFISESGNGDPNDAFYIGYDGDAHDSLIIGNIWFSDYTGGDPANYSVDTLAIGQWNHIALVYFLGDLTGKLYVNGVLADSGAFYPHGSGSVGHLQLGTDVTNTSSFNGMIDGLRIWNAARMPDQIKADMYGTVSATDPNLAAWYQMDEGSPSTTAANISAMHNDIDLTLQGGTDWASGPAIPNTNALTFDNTKGTQVTIPSNAAYDLITSGTIEFDVKPGDLQGARAIMSNRGTSGNRWTVYMDNTPGNSRINFASGASNQDIPYSSGFTINNKWYHISLVTAPDGVGGDTTAAFVNGDYIGKATLGYDQSVTGEPLVIGANPDDPSENWVGGIDEVRLWNTALAKTEIQANMGASIPLTETRLAGSWTFDQGIDNGDNAGLKVAVDNTATTNNGILNDGFLLQPSTASNFMANTPITLPVTFGKFTVAKQGKGAQLKWQTYSESNTKDFIVLRSGNGINFIDIGSVAASGNSHTLKTYYFVDQMPLEGNNYYRIQERDLDLNATYSEVKALSFTRSGDLIWYTTGARSVEIRLQKGSTEQYSISDVGGHMIRTGRLTDGVTSLSDVPGGIYFVTVYNGIGDKQTTRVLLP